MWLGVQRVLSPLPRQAGSIYFTSIYLCGMRMMQYSTVVGCWARCAGHAARGYEPGNARVIQCHALPKCSEMYYRILI